MTLFFILSIFDFPTQTIGTLNRIAKLHRYNEIKHMRKLILHSTNSEHDLTGNKNLEISLFFIFLYIKPQAWVWL